MKIMWLRLELRLGEEKTKTVSNVVPWLTVHIFYSIYYTEMFIIAWSVFTVLIMYNVLEFVLGTITIGLGKQ